jgi:hypothetical protein
MIVTRIAASNIGPVAAHPIRTLIVDGPVIAAKIIGPWHDHDRRHLVAVIGHRRRGIPIHGRWRRGVTLLDRRSWVVARRWRLDLSLRIGMSAAAAEPVPRVPNTIAPATIGMNRFRMSVIVLPFQARRHPYGHIRRCPSGKNRAAERRFLVISTTGVQVWARRRHAEAEVPSVRTGDVGGIVCSGQYGGRCHSRVGREGICGDRASGVVVQAVGDKRLSLVMKYRRSRIKNTLPEPHLR